MAVAALALNIAAVGAVRSADAQQQDPTPQKSEFYINATDTSGTCLVVVSKNPAITSKSAGSPDVTMYSPDGLILDWNGATAVIKLSRDQYDSAIANCKPGEPIAILQKGRFGNVPKAKK